ncbi:MAG: response regulator [Cyanobacteria bacterium]|nr:response regulator [Cyanobacteriota bacterium]
MPKLLVVDDEKSIREIIAIAMEDEWTVLCVSSGTDALQVARVEQPDLILLDRMMPEMDGLRTLERLREEPTTAAIPVIFLTAKLHIHDISDPENRDVLGILHKPFNPMTLPDEVRALIEASSSKR